MPEDSSSSNGSAVGTSSSGSSNGSPPSQEFGSPKQAAAAQRILSAPEENGQDSGTPGDRPDGGPLESQEKRESRYARTKRLKAELRNRENALSQREAQLAQAEQEKKAPPKPKYTVEELREYRAAWEEDGKFELVEKADKEIARLEKLEADQVSATRETIELPRYGTKEHKDRWEKAEQLIQQENPDFMKRGSPLDNMVRAIMQSPYGQGARDHPEGIWAVYSEAQKELLKQENQSLSGRVKELEQELERATGLTSIGGGAPSKLGGGGRVEGLKDFSKLSSSEMKKRLTSTRGNGSGMPWL